MHISRDDESCNSIDMEPEVNTRPRVRNQMGIFWRSGKIQNILTSAYREHKIETRHHHSLKLYKPCSDKDDGGSYDQ